MQDSTNTNWDLSELASPAPVFASESFNLLIVDFIRELEWAQANGVRPERRATDRSLLPLFFSPREADHLEDQLSKRLFSSTRILRDRCIGSFPNLPEGQRSGSYRSGHQPSVPV